MKKTNKLYQVNVAKIACPILPQAANGTSRVVSITYERRSMHLVLPFLPRGATRWY